MFAPLLVMALTALPTADDLSARLDDVLFRIAEAEGTRRWELARELRDTARTDSIQSVPILREAAAHVPDSLRLVIARTLVDVDAVPEAAELLLELVDGEVGEGALSLLADRAFRQVEEVSDRLEEMLAQPLPAGRRIDVARTLYKVSRSGRTRTEARRELLATLESDEPDIRAEGALALAEINDFESARPVLRTLTADPGPRGQLARAYLETDDRINYYTERLYQQAERVPSGRPWGSESFREGPGSLDVIEELIDRVQTHHLLGEELKGAEGRERLITAAAKGMLNTLDPHSTYFSSAEFERWILDLRRHYAGIGAYVDTIEQVFTITKPIYSGPAYAAGLMSGDQIIKVDGWDTFGEPNDEIIRRLKGEPGTEVTVTVYRKGWQKTRDFVITRQVIDIDSVNWELLPGDIGYVEVLSFAESTSAELVAAIEELSGRGMQGLILDLRNNSGGYLDQAVLVSSLFLPQGQLVVYTEGRGVRRQEFRTRPVPHLPDGPYEGPLVVLVNNRSASASEIVAGAIQQAGRSQLVGDQTFGKGSVQQAMELETRPGDRLLTDLNNNGVYDPGERYEDVDGDGKYSYPVSVKITNARYYLADGTSLHTERDLDGRIVERGGILPDVEVPFEGIPGWQNHEWALLLEELDGENPFEDYVREQFPDDPDLFYALAEGDGHDPLRYPDWQAFRDALPTALPDDTLRLILRGAVRNRVADDRGKAFPGGLVYGNWQEDNQLQTAIAVLADTMDLDLTAYEAFDDLAGLDRTREEEPGEPR